MRNEISLAHFLRTGELGPLNFTLTIKDIYRLFGKPEKAYRPFAYLGGEDDDQINLIYKSLVIVFTENALDEFTLYFYMRDKGFPRALGAQLYSEIKKADYRFFVNFLKAHNIFCQRIVTPGVESKDLFINHNDQHFILIAFDPDEEDRVRSIVCSAAGTGKNWQFEDCE